VVYLHTKAVRTQFTDASLRCLKLNILNVRAVISTPIPDEWVTTFGCPVSLKMVAIFRCQSSRCILFDHDYRGGSLRLMIPIPWSLPGVIFVVANTTIQKGWPIRMRLGLVKQVFTVNLLIVPMSYASVILVTTTLGCHKGQ
jgi:hypothetical protein